LCPDPTNYSKLNAVSNAREVWIRIQKVGTVSVSLTLDFINLVVFNFETKIEALRTIVCGTAFLESVGPGMRDLKV
jgi:hypothetical protein